MKNFLSKKPSKTLHYLNNKFFSIIHNYHCPHTLWINNKYVMFDDKLNEYNQYIQAFLTKRFTHKKEVPPKIKVIKDNFLKEYHNTFYIQKMYPMYTLVDYSYLKYMHSHKIYDSGYILSRFCEDYEKNLMDAVLEKVLICGRVEFLEDKENFDKLRSEVNKLVDVFYNGDKLSPFEREIERTYLYLKQAKYNEILEKYRISQKKRNEECHLTFSEKNKLSGHVNFRMKHPTYFFQPRPIFETINVENMFNSLYEMRYNTLKYYQIYSKLKLKFQYRKSLLKKRHRIEFVTFYIYLQIYQYLESFEFNNEFNLSLNFRINFNLIVFHCWLIIQRLQKIALTTSDKYTKNFCDYIIEELIQKVTDNFKSNLEKFQFSQSELPQIRNIKKFIHKVLDFYTWHFEVLHKNNNLENLRNLLNETIFVNTLNIDDKNLKKLCYYAYIHYEYLKTKSYKEIESCDFDFSIYRIPMKIDDFISNKDHFSEAVPFYNVYINLDKEEIKDIFINNYKQSKNLFFNKFISKSNNKNEIYKELINNYGINPFQDKKNYVKLDLSKGIFGKLDRFLKSDLNLYNAYEFEKLKWEEEMSKPADLGTVWDSNKPDEEQDIAGLGYVDKIKERRNKYLKQMEEKNSSKVDVEKN